MGNHRQWIRDLIKEKSRYDSRADKVINNLKDNANHNFEVITNKSDPSYTALIYYRRELESLISPKSRVLELGAGMGENTEPLILTGCNLYLLDISEVSLGVAKKRWGERVNIVPGNIEDIPFSDDYFDFVVGAGCLSYGDPRQVDKEISRVLKPGGTLIMVDALNHNPIYVLNRVKHLVFRNRSLSTLFRIPKTKRLDEIGKMYHEVDIQFFGVYLWLYKLTKEIFGHKSAVKIYEFFEKKSKRKKLAFKFVYVGRYLKSIH
jgi:SAM-dependent methyltransferase